MSMYRAAGAKPYLSPPISAQGARVQPLRAPTRYTAVYLAARSGGAYTVKAAPPLTLWRGVDIGVHITRQRENRRDVSRDDPIAQQ